MVIPIKNLSEWALPVGSQIKVAGVACGLATDAVVVSDASPSLFRSLHLAQIGGGASGGGE